MSRRMFRLAIELYVSHGRYDDDGCRYCEILTGVSEILTGVSSMSST